MIKGIGIDIVSLLRIKNLAKDVRFLERIYTTDELSILETISNEDRKIEFLAGRFAAKEAIFKAYKKGDGSANYRDFSIDRNENGEPFVKSIHLNAGETIHISISHDAKQAVAFVILET